MAVIEMKIMVPFYYGLIAVVVGFGAGFCARCYGMTKGYKFFHVLKTSMNELIRISLCIFLLPIWVIFSEKPRRLILHMVINQAMITHNEHEENKLSLSKSSEESLIKIFLEKFSLNDFVQIAFNLTTFYFKNLNIVAFLIVRTANETTGNEIFFFNFQKNFYHNKSVSFYEKNFKVQKLFSL